MPDLFGSIFSGDAASSVVVRSFILCVGAALVTGIMYFAAYSFKNRASGSFRTALIMLPAVVAVVIMMVNGNIGVGVATAGAFSLVRFRSAQGNAKEISMIFMAMCSGLIVGVGYIAYAVLFTVIMCVIVMICNCAARRRSASDRTRILKMTVPEDLDYSGAFDGIFGKYTTRVSRWRSEQPIWGAFQAHIPRDGEGRGVGEGVHRQSACEKRKS